MNEGQQKALTEELQKQEWQWLCSLAYRPNLSRDESRTGLFQSMEDICAELGTHQFAWYAFRDSGDDDRVYQCRIVVAGLSKWDAEEQAKWASRWSALFGEARIEHCSTTAPYLVEMVKAWDIKFPDDMDFDTPVYARMSSRAEE
jgi:hypothetical protein